MLCGYYLFELEKYNNNNVNMDIYVCNDYFVFLIICNFCWEDCGFNLIMVW